MKGRLSYPRSNRIGDLIKEEVASLFINGVSDPRLTGVTITDVRLAEDLKIAKIYYVCGAKQDIPKVVKGLESVRGWVRREVSKRINMRYTPEMEFVYDDVFENGMNIDALLRNVKNEPNK